MKKMGQKALYAGKYRSMIEKKFELPSGVLRAYEIVTQNDTAAAMVCAVTKDGKFIMTREFRVGPERYFFDAPGGMVDEGEDMEEAAKRELLEETGYEAGKIEYMGLFYIGAYDETRWQCFLATECERKAEQKLDEAEFIEVVLKSREEVLGEIEKGDMVLGDAAVMMMAMRRIEEKK